MYIKSLIVNDELQFEMWREGERKVNEELVVRDEFFILEKANVFRLNERTIWEPT